MAGEAADRGRWRPLSNRGKHQIHQPRLRPQADPQVRPALGPPLGEVGLTSLE